MRHHHLIVGREDELLRLRGLFEPDGPTCVVIEGEAGIGKTTLWRTGVDEARGRWNVLAARPAEAEASLPFSALGDLLEPLLDADDGPEREALEPALQRGASAEPASRLAVSRAAVALLRRAAARQPLLLAVDDVQWLDPPTAEVLEFALRRLAESPARILVARRSEGEATLPLGLDRAQLPGGVSHLRMGPLGPDGVGAILRDQLGLRLSRPRLLELHGASAGNPFHALEIGRALLDAGSLDDAEPLPVPDRDSLLRRRLGALSEPARTATLLASAAVQPTATLVERAAGAVEGIAEAVQAEVLTVEGDRLRFAHPLLASAAYAVAPPWERRDAHRRLAAAARDGLERAHHLAEATTEADETVAAELEAAAGSATLRGAPGLAARLLERAAELTPDADDGARRRRLLDAVPRHLASGDPAHARRLLEELAAELPAGPERAGLLCQLADVHDGPDRGLAIARQALAESGADPAVGARANVMLATFTSLTGDRVQAAEYARAAASLAKRAGDGRLVAITIGDLCYRLMVLGLPYPRAELERALELERTLPDDALNAHQRPSIQLGVILGYTDHPDEARPLLRAEVERLERAGNESWLIGVLFRLADVELRAGNWAEARRLARRCVAIATHGGVAQEETVALVIHAAVEAHLGLLDEAATSARAAVALAEEGGDRSYALRATAVLGFVELSRGDPEAALAHLSPAGAELRRVGVGELSVQQVVHNEIDALVALGRLPEAEDVIAFVEEKGRPTQRSWHEAVAARGRALVSAARGDFDEARVQLGRALAAHERLPQPFELGRTLLARGTIERRAKHRGEARAALARALEVFDQLGAPLWAEKAAGELARIPGRAPAAHELSETERRIAELVASGLANKEVAAKLFVTVRTVEGNLTRIYSKLGVRSRTELASRLARNA
jgi:DNA-binding CsgD family transcriptional regulator